jgi:hypothetical protein
MATGDRNDIAARLAQLIPPGWFQVGAASVKDAMLQGIAATHAFGYALLAYVRLQTRITTATDGFLDMIAGDFFGSGVARALSQTDASLRSQIITNIFRERGTRAGLVAILRQLTGRTPDIFEPMRPYDTGSYGGPLIGYGVAGGYGSMMLPLQTFVTAYRPPATGIPNVAGYGASTAGYGVGSQAEWASASMVVSAATDADINAAIDSVRPATYLIWSRIRS